MASRICHLQTITKVRIKNIQQIHSKWLLFYLIKLKIHNNYSVRTLAPLHRRVSYRANKTVSLALDVRLTSLCAVFQCVSIDTKRLFRNGRPVRRFHPIRMLVMCSHVLCRGVRRSRKRQQINPGRDVNKDRAVVTLGPHGGDACVFGEGCEGGLNPWAGAHESEN